MAKKKSPGKGSKKPAKKATRNKTVAPPLEEGLGCCIINVGGNVNRIPGVRKDDCDEMIEGTPGATGTWHPGPCPP